MARVEKPIFVWQPLNHINARGVERLMQANWHELRGLTLDIKAISKATWHHLGLSIDAMPNPAEVAQGVTVQRNLAALSFLRVVWPCLLAVKFASSVKS